MPRRPPGDDLRERGRRAVAGAHRPGPVQGFAGQTRGSQEKGGKNRG